jgi:hypothetical protein
VNLGAIALRLVLGISAAGIVAFAIDLAATRYPPSVSSWPVHPLVIVVLTLIGLTIALVLGIRALATKQGRDLGVAAIAVGMLPELLCLATVAAVIGNELT